MKKLINIRGAVASGKTTAVRQFCEHMGFIVEYLTFKGQSVPVSVIDGGRIIVLGDYANSANCAGTDGWHSKKNGVGIKSLIIDALVCICKNHNPEIIIFENMILSQTFKGTKEIADTAKMFGYEYCGVQLYCSETRRAELLEKRSGIAAGKKNFLRYAQRVARASEMLNEAAYLVRVVNVENVVHENMWQVVNNAVNLRS